MIVEGASLCLLYLLIRRRFICWLDEDLSRYWLECFLKGAGFWENVKEVWCNSKYLMIINFNISYLLGFVLSGHISRILIYSCTAQVFPLHAGLDTWCTCEPILQHSIILVQNTWDQPTKWQSFPVSMEHTSALAPACTLPCSFGFCFRPHRGIKGYSFEGPGVCPPYHQCASVLGGCPPFVIASAGNVDLNFPFELLYTLSKMTESSFWRCSSKGSDFTWKLLPLTPLSKSCWFPAPSPPQHLASLP